MLSQGTNHARRESRLGLRAPDHRKRSIASIIVTTLAAPKRTTNRKSPCPAARPQPSAASAESAASYRSPGSFHPALDAASLGLDTQTASIQATQRERK